MYTILFVILDWTLLDLNIFTNYMCSGCVSLVCGFLVKEYEANEELRENVLQIESKKQRLEKLSKQNNSIECFS